LHNIIVYIIYDSKILQHLKLLFHGILVCKMHSIMLCINSKINYFVKIEIYYKMNLVILADGPSSLRIIFVYNDGCLIKNMFNSEKKLNNLFNSRLLVKLFLQKPKHFKNTSTNFNKILYFNEKLHI